MDQTATGGYQRPPALGAVVGRCRSVWLALSCWDGVNGADRHGRRGRGRGPPRADPAGHGRGRAGRGRRPGPGAGQGAGRRGRGGRLPRPHGAAGRRAPGRRLHLRPPVRPRRPRAGRDRRRAAHVRREAGRDRPGDGRGDRRPTGRTARWSPAPATTGAGWTSSTGRPSCWPTGRPGSSSAPGSTRSPRRPGGCAATARAGRRSSRPPTSSTPPGAWPARSPRSTPSAPGRRPPRPPLVPWARRGVAARRRHP